MSHLVSILDPSLLAEVTGNEDVTEIAWVAREKIEGVSEELKGEEA